MDPQPLRFHPVQSFVDSSFFTNLSHRILNEYKLDSSPKRIHGFMAQPLKLNKFNDRPVINLDYNCFEQAQTDALTRTVDGRLYNVNTIEEFKALDKKALLQEWGRDLARSLDHAPLREAFYVVSFCDLKKYRFYYWLAYPVLHSTWFVRRSSPNSELLPHIEKFVGEGAAQFFQAQHGETTPTFRTSGFSKDGVFVYADACLAADGAPAVPLKNHLYMLAARGFRKIELVIYRNNNLSTAVQLELDPAFSAQSPPMVAGWERTPQGRLGPKMADLGSLIDPRQLADQAVDLNLKLMKWRVAPHLDLDVVRRQKVLLLGAGTLGSYVARALMGWGVREINFVDSGRVSYSNPVRQPLFAFRDCFGAAGQGAEKAARASEALAEIFPGVSSKGYNMEVPMIGHPVAGAAEADAERSFGLLRQLFDQHDAVFLLMDSRESRWLPTVMGVAMNKTVINAALGFDSFLVLRHSPLDMAARLGCYFCNDVVAPTDSLSARSLDQMCTVTRPGGALLAASLAVELWVSMLQHGEKNRAPHGGTSSFGDVPHQIRGFLHNFTQTKLSTPAYQHCSACSETVAQMYQAGQWDFVRNCLNSTGYLEEICGLRQVQEDAERAAAQMMDEMSLSDGFDASD
ncbi:E1-like protein-activating [Metschnikowia bicuspidata var. bicuspidata NRRL YB-4993]|uniref:Ubiquitin-like modifier-activating enzyme ATG7 n=1 Tax=Metschnikowia bicuspidata var. bicuspidata NRRL YB-4993 TaxID=869754 RepID=A0A1A0HC07_9ASCO|nr:E1-like protein-activating [Metschnikowia bicuspidata var. bicuspidata NRRL YB-4993]OBA21515.1 E1-like protein-activating [Metschnikowia bicuspidata var. bicuspidata NRRL YB-4993]